MLTIRPFAAMPEPTSSRSLAPHLVCRQFLLTGAAAGQHLLDVGCGEGELMTELLHLGASVQGVEIASSLVQSCLAQGLDVTEGTAEHLPIPDASKNGIVCSVVLPYTDEQQAVAEWARVLKPGGWVNATYHGIGYGLGYLLRGSGAKQRFYGLRMLANTAVYRTTARKLPGFLGDTLCQSTARMQFYYRRCGLTLEREQIVETVVGKPKFLCHRLIKNASPLD